jgi:hypothetical protein
MSKEPAVGTDDEDVGGGACADVFVAALTDLTTTFCTRHTGGTGTPGLATPGLATPGLATPGLATC